MVSRYQTVTATLIVYWIALFKGLKNIRNQVNNESLVTVLYGYFHANAGFQEAQLISGRISPLVRKRNT
jgi:hypothetical protein